MEEAATNFFLMTTIAFGLAIILASFFFVRRKETARFQDHAARTLVTIGAAVAGIAMAFGIFNLNLSQQKGLRQYAQTQERQIVAQNLRSAMLQFGISAYQLKSTRYYCDILSEEKASEPNRAPNFNPTACREAAAFAVKTAGLLPGTTFIFDQAAKGSKTFSSSNWISVFLVDGDAALRGRMPAVLETNVAAYAGTSRTRIAKGVVGRFTEAMYNLQQRADAVAAVLCVLTQRIVKSWDDFDRAVETMEQGLQTEAVQFGAIATYPDAIRALAAGTSFANSDCAHIRNELEKLLPVTGGGNGGGNGE